MPNIKNALAILDSILRFTKIDLNYEYLHLPADSNSKKLLTVNNFICLFHITRTSYGIPIYPPKLQRIIEYILTGIDCTLQFIQDINVSAETDEVHLERLISEQDRWQEYSIKINKEKSFLMKKEISEDTK